MNIQVAAITENTIQSQRGQAACTENTEPTGNTQPARKNRACGKTVKMELCQRTEKNSPQALAGDKKNMGDIEDTPAASYFSFEIVIIISYMKCCFGAAKTDCTDIGFLK